MSLARLTQILIIAAPFLAMRQAQAESPCGCADPTQNTLSLDGEAERRDRFDLRSTLAVELRGRQLVGDEADLIEERVQVGLSASLAGGWSLAVALPLAWQQMDAGGTRSGVGDVEVRARLPLHRTADHAVFALAGGSLPTARTLGSTTDRLDVVPLGHGDVAPLVGAAYLYTRERWSLLAAPALRLIVADDPTLLLEASLYAQWQPSSTLAVRLGVEAGAPLTTPEAADLDEGGHHALHKRALRADQLHEHHATQASVGPEVLWSAGEKLLIAAGVAAPVYQDGGPTEEGLRVRVLGSVIF
jgi:hypothetical protein